VWTYNFLPLVEGRTKKGGMLKKIFGPEKEPIKGGWRNAVMKRFFAILQKY
jgi:hypothetical protein